MRSTALTCLWALCLPLSVFAQGPPETRAVESFSLVSLQAGQETTIAVCWDHVPGGRAPKLYITNSPGRPTEETLFDEISTYQIGNLTMTVEAELSEELYKLLDQRKSPSIPGPIPQVVTFKANSNAAQGVTDVYLHYISGTGRNNYRRAAVRVVIASGKN